MAVLASWTFAFFGNVGRNGCGDLDGDERVPTKASGSAAASGRRAAKWSSTAEITPQTTERYGPLRS